MTQYKPFTRYRCFVGFLGYMAMTIAVIFSAGCTGSSIAQPPAAQSYSIQDAQRLIDASTNTAVAMSTQAALSTATRVARLEATSDAAFVLAVEESSRNKTATVSADMTQTVRQAIVDQVDLTNAEEWGATSRAAIWAFVVVLSVLTALAGLVSLTYGKLWYNADQSRRDSEHEIKLLTMKIAALSAALRETHAGTAVPTISGEWLFLPPAHSVADSQFVSDAPSAPTIVINENGFQHVIGRLTPQEIKATTEMLDFLDAAISKVGVASNRVPRWHTMGIASEDWQRNKSLFGDLLRSDTTGTYTAQDATLGDLRRRIKFGELSPVLTTQ